jgi:hypothetical protein
MRAALVAAAVAAALYGLHRLGAWAEDRGYVNYRRRAGSSGSLGNAMLEVQALLEPTTRHILEERVRDDREQEPDAAPPRPGEGRRRW